MRAPLLALTTEAEGQISRLQDGLGVWFDARDFLTAAYRRHVKWLLLGVAIIVTPVFNVDSIRAARTFYEDEASSDRPSPNVHRADHSMREHVGKRTLNLYPRRGREGERVAYLARRMGRGWRRRWTAHTRVVDRGHRAQSGWPLLVRCPAKGQRPEGIGVLNVPGVGAAVSRTARATDT
jgi:hypothetical protein